MWAPLSASAEGSPPMLIVRAYVWMSDVIVTASVSVEDAEGRSTGWEGRGVYTTPARASETPLDSELRACWEATALWGELELSERNGSNTQHSHRD